MPYIIPNYAPITEPGKSRRRVYRNENENILGEQPYAIMHEEDVALVEVDGVLIERPIPRKAPLPRLIHIPRDPNEIVELRSLIDDTLLGTTTIGAIHTHVYSLARHMQKIRDTEETNRIANLEAAEEEAAAAFLAEIAARAVADAKRIADAAAEAEALAQAQAAAAAALAAEAANK